MFDYFAMAYKDWLYHHDRWSVLTQIYILVLTLTLVQELWALCLAVGHHCSSTRFNFCWQYSSPERFWPHCCECCCTL